MYSTPSQVENVLAQSMTSASTSALASSQVTPVKLGQVGTKMAPALYTTDIVNYYIRLADSHIDAALSQMYVTPLPEICDLQMKLTADIDEYSTTIRVDRAANLGVGDVLFITDGVNTDRIEVSTVTVPDLVTPVAMPLNLYTRSAANRATRVLRLSYPAPIPFLSARLACAGLFDKYYASQQEPGKTEYGEKLRSLVNDEMNNIREGRTILTGVRRIGWRFANPNLVDRYTLKGSIEQDSTRSSNGNR
jgi:hypothetical protein